ncbi:MAG: YceI family protein [Polyangiaceae bacterium]
MSLRFSLGALAPTALLVGCGSAPLAHVETSVPDAVAVRGAVEEYSLVGDNVAVEADVRASAAYTVHFPNSKGTLKFAPDAHDASSFELDIDVTVATSSLQIVADIARDKFLHAGDYPTARFATRSLRPGLEAGSYTLFGDLTLHGKTLSLSMPAHVVADDCHVSIDVEFGVDRQAFGVVATGVLEDVVSNTVVVRIKTSVLRQSCKG